MRPVAVRNDEWAHALQRPGVGKRLAETQVISVGVAYGAVAYAVGLVDRRDVLVDGGEQQLVVRAWCRDPFSQRMVGPAGASSRTSKPRRSV
jgi:hypothetical protein